MYTQEQKILAKQFTGNKELFTFVKEELEREESITLDEGLTNEQIGEKIRAIKQATKIISNKLDKFKQISKENGTNSHKVPK